MWRKLDPVKKEDFAVWRSLYIKLSDPEKPRNLYADPVWLADPERSYLQHSLLVYIEDSIPGNEALAVFIVRNISLPLYIGELKIYSLNFQCATLADFQTPEGLDRHAMLCDLMLSAPCDLDREAVLHMETHDLGFAKDLAAVRKNTAGGKWLWLEYDRHIHRYIRLGISFKQYFGQLSKNTRRTVKRGRNKLKADGLEDLGLSRVTEAYQIDDFLMHAQQVSRKTYQWQLLGSGLRDIDSLRDSLRFAAKHGWLRCYLYFIGRKPAAFLLGYLYAGTYLPTQTGYDPALEKYSIGMMMFSDVIADLFDTQTVEWFDFGSGDALYKRSLANVAINGGRVYLWPKTWKNYLRIELYRQTRNLDCFLRETTTRLGLKAWLKKHVRKLKRESNGIRI